MPEASFLLEPIVASDEPASYSRREWRSPFGGSYYSWDNSKLPNYLFARQTFWNEARRHRLVPGGGPGIVYHYTSLEGFVGIVSSRSLWLSDYGYLNDKRELTYGTDLVSAAIQHISQSHPSPSVTSLLRSWQANLRSIGNRVCIASFSEDGDSLSQWRAYGPIAIGFPTRPLALHVNQALLQAVEYEPTVQRRLIDTYLHHFCQAYEFDASNGRLTNVPTLYEKVGRFLELIAFFKDPAFRSEREYRLTFVEDPEVVALFGHKGTEKSFRITKGRLRPYVSSLAVLPSEHRRFPLEIEEVVLGPEGDELLERGTREFLDANGMTTIPVRRSTVPLRP